MTTFPEKTVFDAEILDQIEETRVSIERPVLLLLDGTDVNHRYSIDKPQMIIGRDILCDVVVNDNRCSRRHIKLFYDNFNRPGASPEVYLEDLGSTNGTFVNNTRLTGRQLLTDRDKIMIGSTLFGYSVRNQDELQADQRLLELATLDALTGLFNRGWFNREALKEFDRARRYKRDVALVLFDIDHFKRFNDTYGHQMGDFVLQEMGRLVRLNQRSNDVCARYGGEEFALVLPETGIEGAIVTAERLRVAVETNTFAREGTNCRVTISLGIAAYEPSMKNCDELIRWSDRALYKAKESGRNCTFCAIGGEMTPVDKTSANPQSLSPSA